MKQTFAPDAMKTVGMTRASLYSAAGFILLCAIASILAQARTSITLNENAVTFATQLIKEGHVNADARGAWKEHQPSVAEENEFIRVQGFGEYAKWHLGIDERYPQNTKRRYKFPYGDFKTVHRCGLLAARSRAAEYRHDKIADAAARLIAMISEQEKGVAAPLRSP